MKILISYATNSGSCFLVAERIQKILAPAHTVVVQLAAKTTPDDIEKNDCIILGTPSWSVEGHEGYPQESMLKLLRAGSNHNFPSKLFALYGCGDNSYTFFCGAVDHLENFVISVKGQTVLESLRLDSYFFELKRNNDLVDAWTQKIAKKLLSY